MKHKQDYDSLPFAIHPLFHIPFRFSVLRYLAAGAYFISHRLKLKGTTDPDIRYRFRESILNTTCKLSKSI